MDTEKAAYSAPGEREFSAPGERALREQVERILQSKELCGCEVLRRLLKFLADRSASGEADGLKEYIVAVDGLGKPPSYDPRHNSAVRIQVGRLRQKLADYYRHEGQDDPLLIDVPKGRFKLKFECRDGASPAPPPAPAPVILPAMTVWRKRAFREVASGLRLPAAVAAGVLLALGVGAAYNTFKPAGAKAKAVAYTPSWNADIEELWRPFIAGGRRVIVAIEDPQTAPGSDSTDFGQVDSSFLLAKLLGSRVPNLSVVKSSDLSMRELAGNNVVLAGSESIFFTGRIQAAPLQPVHGGIRNHHPGPNEPAVFVDRYSTGPPEEGVAYALVTHAAGPLGGSDVESFTCSRAVGYVAAVKSFTDPAFASELVRKLKAASGGKMPRYYQVLLKVKFAGEAPAEVTYVLARELHDSSRS